MFYFPPYNRETRSFVIVPFKGLLLFLSGCGYLCSPRPSHWRKNSHEVHAVGVPKLIFIFLFFWPEKINSHIFISLLTLQKSQAYPSLGGGVMQWGGVVGAKRDGCWEWLAAGLGVSAPTSFHYKNAMGLLSTLKLRSKIRSSQKNTFPLRG